MTYTYTRHTYRPDSLYHKETVTLTERELLDFTPRCNRAGFLSLINSWNKQGVASKTMRPDENPVYVYVVED